MTKRFGVIIVNYKSAPLAVDAALSVLGDAPNAKVIIVDNASGDGSLSYLRDVMAGRRAHSPEPPAGDDPSPVFAPTSLAARSTEVIASPDNRGFAAGCNIGLKRFANDESIDALLLLNPDALVAKGSMAAFAERLDDSAAGLCGASILRFEPPHEAQAFGGAAFNAVTLLGANIGAGGALATAPSRETVERKLDYPIGAAIALRKDYLDCVGYLDERFFLYYEEIDWAQRGLPSLKPVWAPEAIVYHRHGAAAGSRIRPGARSPFSDYHMARSRMLYALKWAPHLAPVLIGAGALQAVRRFARGDMAQAGAVLRGSLPGAGREAA